MVFVMLCSAYWVQLYSALGSVCLSGYISPFKPLTKRLCGVTISLERGSGLWRHTIVLKTSAHVFTCVTEEGPLLSVSAVTYMMKGREYWFSTATNLTHYKKLSQSVCIWGGGLVGSLMARGKGFVRLPLLQISGL